MTDPIRVLLVDDQSLVRSGFRMILGTRKDIVVVGEAEDGDQVLAAVDARVPDVVLMDVRMPRMDGIAATRELIRRHSRVRVLILTTFDLDEYVVEALRSGASGFLLKDSTAPELIAGVKAVARGDSVVAPSATRRLLGHWISGLDDGAGVIGPAYGRGEAPAADSGAGGGADDERLAPLSAREKEILALVGRALSNREIAETLVLAESTVKTHINRLLRKLSMRDRAGLIVLAHETGLIRPGQDE